MKIVKIMEYNMNIETVLSIPEASPSAATSIPSAEGSISISTVASANLLP